MSERSTIVVKRSEPAAAAGRRIVVVDRSTRWGNRFTHRRFLVDDAARRFEELAGAEVEYVPDRDAAITAHRIEFIERIGGEECRELVEWLTSIRGCALACHCAPLPCHADTYAELADMSHAELYRLVEIYT